MHGGLRYLEQLVRWCTRRSKGGLHTTSVAPHLVRPISFIHEVASGSGPCGAGVLIYDLMAFARGKSFAIAT